MAEKEKKGRALSDYDLGLALAEIRAGVVNLTNQLTNVIADFKEVHTDFKELMGDHEQRIRTIEANGAKKGDVNKVHERVDKTNDKIESMEKTLLAEIQGLRTNQWKTWLILVGSGSVGGGFGAMLAKLFLMQ